MELFVDTSKKDLIKIAIGGQDFEKSGENVRGQLLLEFIVTKLKDKNLEIKDIDKISFFEGPGSFTGLRVGASVLSAISWEYKIPVNGKVVDKDNFLKIVY